MDTPQSPAVYTLLKLHSDLHGRLQQNRKEAVKLRADMKHVEAVIKLLQSDYPVRNLAPRRKNAKNPWFKRGTVFRAVLAVLRDAPEPMSAYELAEALLRQKGVTEPTRDQVNRMYGAIEASLRNHDGKTVKGDKDRPRRWRLSALKTQS